MLAITLMIEKEVLFGARTWHKIDFPFKRLFHFWRSHSESLMLNFLTGVALQILLFKAVLHNLRVPFGI